MSTVPTLSRIRRARIQRDTIELQRTAQARHLRRLAADTIAIVAFVAFVVATGLAVANYAAAALP